MNNTYKIIVLLIAIAQLVLASVVNQATVFNLGAAQISVLGIIAAVLTLIANYLPSLFGESPAAKS